MDGGYPFSEDVKREVLLLIQRTEKILPEIIEKIKESSKDSLARGVSCGPNDMHTGTTGITIFPDGYPDSLEIPRINIQIGHPTDCEENILSEGIGITFRFSDHYRKKKLREREKPT